MYQEIATHQLVAYDESGASSNNKTFFIPTNERALVGLLNSKLAWWFLHQVCSKLRGNALAMQTPYVSQLPIAPATDAQKSVLERLVDYVLYVQSEVPDGAGRDGLMLRYFEQIIDALVYELYLPDELAASGRSFCAPLTAEGLPALTDLAADKLATLRGIFERLFDRNHSIRQNIFFLDTLASIRIIEGKA